MSKLTTKQKELLIKWVELAKGEIKITGADDLSITMYQKLTEIKDMPDFEKQVNEFLHAYNFAKEYHYI